MLFMNFRLIKKDAKTRARAALFKTAHGDVVTPVFMPVGTQGSVKAISPQDLNDIGAEIILGNTYHLYLRPGAKVVYKAGGLQKFNSWHKPILTDSGGFQIFSLNELNKITPDGFAFRSHLDGSEHFFSPETVIDIQRDLGSDIMMVLDECVSYPAEYSYVRESIRLTIDWAEKSLKSFQEIPARHGFSQTIFAIVQGSVYAECRRDCTLALRDLDFPGYAIGGLSVGEPKQAMYEMTDIVTELLPENKPRYLMGVGKPEDLLEGIQHGIDMFDCILPTRNGRNGQAFTADGPINIKNNQNKEAFEPLDKECTCMTCRHFSRAYLRHLYMAKELLVLKLLSYHNLFFYIALVKRARKAILQDRFLEFKKEFLARYTNNQG
ncbi:tRNA guanosine(34) transglycosylase Tgt [candidate division KSB1 bacterium]|nr:tRNA guanosine(34) transglycosylase Tgt [candidate division KSB1 bacterium]RQW07011.1 MAG: tRNA guanosine(34) transglycosylase Tgt [candidate division KSB1 bacterium]